MRSLPALLILVGMAGCVSIPEPAAVSSEECVDADGDGYLPLECASDLPRDCAPEDPDIHPGAFDECGNQVDEDCLDSDLLCSDAIIGNTVVDLGAPGFDSGLLEVANGQARVAFDADQGFAISHLSSPALSGDNLLYTGQMEERLIGSHLWQDSFSWLPDERDISQLASGPVIESYRVQWTASGGGGTMLTGSTTYSVFPDGRIHRAEELSPMGEASFFSSYVALDPARFTHRLRPVNSRDPLPLLSEGELAAASSFDLPYVETDTLFQGSTCAFNANADGHELLGYAWNVHETQPGGGLRLPQSMLGGDADNHQFGLVYDWQRDQGPTPGTYQGGFQMIVGATAGPGSAADCDALEDEALAFIDPGQVSGLSTDPATPGDRDGDGYNEDGGFYQGSAESSSQLNLQFSSSSDAGVGRNPVLRVAAVPSSYPVILRGTELLSHGRDYLLQFEDDSLWIFFNIPVEAVALRIEFP